MRSIFETLIVFAVMTGILLPTRLLFVEYVSDDWLGSVGVIGAISILVLVLAKKNKLGIFGPMLERQIYKFQKGKRGIVIFGESIFLLILLGGMIFAIEQGNSTYAELKLQTFKDYPIETQEQIVEQAKELTHYDWFIGFITTPVAFITAFPQMSAIIASIDERFDGWLLHFYTVGFVEYLEVLGILMFYRFTGKKNKLSNLPYKNAIQPQIENKSS